MNHVIRVPLLVLLLIVASSVGALAETDETAIAPGEAGPVFIESTDILLLESFPVQVVLVVRGQLPTPCHEPAWEVQDLGDRIAVSVWSLVEPDVICVQVLEPFELAIPLGEYESADLPVWLNGEPIGRIKIGTPPSTVAPTLVGAGWSFGMCGGYCQADLELRNDELVLTGRSHMLEDPLYVNGGELTALGRERIDEALTDLRGVVLEPVYGCPDCADGGAAYVTLERGGKTSQHLMNFSPPAEELAALHGLSMAIIDDLEACTSSELVVTTDDCVPFGAP